MLVACLHLLIVQIVLWLATILFPNLVQIESYKAFLIAGVIIWIVMAIIRLVAFRALTRMVTAMIGAGLLIQAFLATTIMHIAALTALLASLSFFLPGFAIHGFLTQLILSIILLTTHIRIFFIARR